MPRAHIHWGLRWRCLRHAPESDSHRCQERTSIGIALALSLTCTRALGPLNDIHGCPAQIALT
eukprot:13363675-Alexandrium_andersonii.AAC.1